MWLHGSNEFIVHSHVQDIPENGADIGVAVDEEIRLKKFNKHFL